jgi:ATP phosphoribosyltransferase regulatory subunit
MARWLLPDNISDVLPEEARRVERLRRALLDLYRGYGYELVIPPLIEHLDSLLTGTGHDLDLATFKIIDQSSGRSLGLRADATPQAARIDAHILNRTGVVRLCYAGSTLHARARHPLASREPIQVGAELYGDAGVDADLEVLELAVRSARVAGAGSVLIDLGHTGVLRAVLAGDPAAGGQVDDILTALNAKDPAALAAAVGPLNAVTRRALHELAALHGGAEVIAQARRRLPAHPALAAALDELARLAERCEAEQVSVDLADLHGFRYHTGATFAAYVDRLPGPLLRGGRYDDIGRAFGRARPATGFSILDLREAALLSAPAPASAIRAPHDGDPALAARVAELRAAGEIVVRAGAATGPDGSLTFDRELRQVGGHWQVVALAPGRGA